MLSAARGQPFGRQQPSRARQEEADTKLSTIAPTQPPFFPTMSARGPKWDAIVLTTVTVLGAGVAAAGAWADSTDDFPPAEPAKAGKFFSIFLSSFCGPPT